MKKTYKHKVLSLLLSAVLPDTVLCDHVIGMLLTNIINVERSAHEVCWKDRFLEKEQGDVKKDSLNKSLNWREHLENAL